MVDITWETSLEQTFTARLQGVDLVTWDGSRRVRAILDTEVMYEGEPVKVELIANRTARDDETLDAAAIRAVNAVVAQHRMLKGH